MWGPNVLLLQAVKYAVKDQASLFPCLSGQRSQRARTQNVSGNLNFSAIQQRCPATFCTNTQSFWSGETGALCPQFHMTAYPDNAAVSIFPGHYRKPSQDLAFLGVATVAAGKAVVAVDSCWFWPGSEAVACCMNQSCALRRVPLPVARM